MLVTNHVKLMETPAGFKVQETWNYTLHIIEDKQVNLNKLIFNGSAKLFEFPKRTSVPPAHSYPVANVTQRYRNASNPKKSACRNEKNKQK